MKKGEVTPQPVQTQYGWHVIQLEDTRDATPPPFDQVKPQLTNAVIRKKLQAYVAELKKNAKIEKNLRGKRANPKACQLAVKEQRARTGPLDYFFQQSQERRLIEHCEPSSWAFLSFEPASSPATT